MPVKIKAMSTKRKSVAIKNKSQHYYPLFHWLVFWTLVLCTVALVCAIFGNVDVNTLMRTSVSDNTQQMEEQAMIEELKAEVANLQAKVQSVETVPAQPEKPFKRICMTAGLAVSDKYLTYIDQKTGVSMTLPYDVAETDGCLVPTVRDDENGVAFGPLVGSEGGSDQDSFIRILPVTSTNAILKGLNVRTSDQENPVKNIRQRTISGLTVISHEETSVTGGGASYWYAIGRNFSYQIGSLGALSDTEAIKIIQSLRVTK